MLTMNIDIADCLTNGQLGTVVGFKVNSSNDMKTVYVNFDDQLARKNAKKQNADPLAYCYNAVPINQTLARIKICDKRQTSPEIERTQFPLCLAWACTIHKVQGLTLDKLVVCFNLYGQHSFNYGQIYVALSRVTSIEGLYILGDFDPAKHIKADDRVNTEYQRLQRDSLSSNTFSEYLSLPNLSDSNFVFTLLNVRSLRKHFADIMADNAATACDIFVMTETLLHPEESIHKIEEAFFPSIITATQKYTLWPGSHASANNTIDFPFLSFQN